MSMKIECSVHHIKLEIPENDHEFASLVENVDELISHNQEFPSCKFVEVPHA